MELEFANPLYALLVVPVAAGAFLILARPRRSLPVPELGAFVRGPGSAVPLLLSRLPDCLVGLGALALVVAVMRPQLVSRQDPGRRPGIDLLLLLDVSGSMRACDLPSGMTAAEAVEAWRHGRIRSRLRAAKDELRRFVRARPDDRLGLLAFSAFPTLECPPTMDHDFLLGRLAGLSTTDYAEGTNLAAVVAAATTRLKDAASPRRVAVLFTDGRNTISAPITPAGAGELARVFHVVVHTVAVGSGRAVLPLESASGLTLSEVDVEVDEAELRNIAEATGGIFMRATDADGLGRAVDHIDSLEKVELRRPVKLRRREAFMPWLGGGLVLLALALVLENSRCQVLP